MTRQNRAQREGGHRRREEIARIAASLNVWDTEDAACVFGTHDVEVAQVRYDRYLREDAGMNEADIAEYGATLEEWSTASKMWADPRSLELEEEIWPEDMYGTEPKDGWVPYLWLVR